jgi:hypothetical protein
MSPDYLTKTINVVGAICLSMVVCVSTLLLVLVIL